MKEQAIEDWWLRGCVRSFGGAAYYHQQFANQEIDTMLANGTTTYDSNGTSNYNDVNIFFDDDPLQNLHLFANANIEAASYNSYITGG